MLLATAVNSMLETREALRKQEGLSNPTYISEQIQKLAQYTGAVEEILAEDEAQLVKDEAAKFKSYMNDHGKSPNMASNLLRYDFVDDRAEIVKLTRLCNSAWKIIGVAQSRVKHLIAEATNQI
jgi:hypothetical protein